MMYSYISALMCVSLGVLVVFANLANRVWRYLMPVLIACAVALPAMASSVHSNDEAVPAANEAEHAANEAVSIVSDAFHSLKQGKTDLVQRTLSKHIDLDNFGASLLPGVWHNMDDKRKQSLKSILNVFIGQRLSSVLRSNFISSRLSETHMEILYVKAQNGLYAVVTKLYIGKHANKVGIGVSWQFICNHSDVKPHHLQLQDIFVGGQSILNLSGSGIMYYIQHTYKGDIDAFIKDLEDKVYQTDKFEKQLAKVEALLSNKKD